jgi:hypothetical protein
MRFFYDNQIDLSGVVFTPTSEVSTLPAENVAHEFRKKVWRTGSISSTERLVIDLGSAKAITSIILLDHTLLQTDSSITLEAHTSDSWGAPSFTQALTWASGTISQTFSTQTYRYWRLSFTKATAASSRDIGRIFLGPYYETSIAPDYDGYEPKLIDPSAKEKTRGGQTYTDVREKYSELRVDFSETTNSQKESFEDIADAVGEAVSFFVQVDTASPLDKIWYVKFSDPFRPSLAGVDSAYLWDITLNMEEQL